MVCSDGWTIATAVGTIGATATALGIAVWQHVSDQIVARKVSRAIAPALIGDLVTAAKLMETIGVFGRDAGNAQPRVALRLAYTLSAPAFDRFKDLLPNLGRATAPRVIDVYVKIIRTGEMVRAYTSKEDDVAELELVIDSLMRNAPSLQESIQDAIASLRSL